VPLPTVIIRGGREKTLKVKLGELPEDKSVARATEDPQIERTNRIGFSAIDLTDEQKQALEIKDGVLVTHVIEGPASQAGIRKEDIILSIDSKPVQNLEQFQKLVNAFPAGKSVALLVQREGSPTFLAVKIPNEE